MTNLPYEPRESNHQGVSLNQSENYNSGNLEGMTDRYDRYYGEHAKRGKFGFGLTVAAAGLAALLGFGNGVGYTAQQSKKGNVQRQKMGYSKKGPYEKQLIGYLSDDLEAHIEGNSLKLRAIKQLRKLGEKKTVNYFELIIPGKKIHFFKYTNKWLTINLAKYDINPQRDNYQVAAVHLKNDGKEITVKSYASQNSKDILKYTESVIERKKKKEKPTKVSKPAVETPEEKDTETIQNWFNDRKEKTDALYYLK